MRKTIAYLTAMFMVANIFMAMSAVNGVAAAKPDNDCWCCIEGKIGKLSPEKCKKHGGRCYKHKSSAHKECRREKGWCCIDGRILKSSQNKCDKSGGRYYKHRASAYKECKEKVCWCCLDGKVGKVRAKACNKDGGQCFRSKASARKECARELFWCCIDGRVIKTSLRACKKRGGKHFQGKQEATKACRDSRCWCCANGKLGEIVAKKCQKHGGKCFKSKAAGLKNCRDDKCWCCYDGKLRQYSPPDCKRRGGECYKSRRVAVRECREEKCWCCINDQLRRLYPGGCKRRGGKCFESGRVAKRECRPGIDGARCNKPPTAQVVNNSGHIIHRVKVGNVSFRRHLSRCSDGCSTGFKDVETGKQTIAIKKTSGSRWEKIGAVDKFRKCKPHAINIISKGDRVCAQLAFLEDTDTPYNQNSTKKVIDKTCSDIKGWSAPTRITPQEPTLRPDLKVDKLWLDNKCRLMVRLMNQGPGELSWAHRKGLLLSLDYDKQTAEFPLDKIDPKGALKEAKGEIVYKTGIILKGAKPVKVAAQLDASPAEKNPKNNKVTRALKPSCQEATASGKATIAKAPLGKDEPGADSEESGPPITAFHVDEGIFIESPDEDYSFYEGETITVRYRFTREVRQGEVSIGIYDSESEEEITSTTQSYQQPSSGAGDATLEAQLTLPSNTSDGRYFVKATHSNSSAYGQSDDFQVLGNSTRISFIDPDPIYFQVAGRDLTLGYRFHRRVGPGAITFTLRRKSDDQVMATVYKDYMPCAPFRNEGESHIDLPVPIDIYEPGEGYEQPWDLFYIKAEHPHASGETGDFPIGRRGNIEQGIQIDNPGSGRYEFYAGESVLVSYHFTQDVSEGNAHIAIVDEETESEIASTDKNYQPPTAGAKTPLQRVNLALPPDTSPGKYFVKITHSPSSVYGESGHFTVRPNNADILFTHPQANDTFQPGEDLTVRYKFKHRVSPGPVTFTLRRLNVSNAWQTLVIVRKDYTPCHPSLEEEESTVDITIPSDISGDDFLIKADHSNAEGASHEFSVQDYVEPTSDSGMEILVLGPEIKHYGDEIRVRLRSNNGLPFQEFEPDYWRTENRRYTLYLTPASGPDADAEHWPLYLNSPGSCSSDRLSCTYTYTLPDYNAAQAYQIFGTDEFKLKDPRISHASSGTFYIRPEGIEDTGVRIESPEEDDVWPIGGKKTVRWRLFGFEQSPESYDYELKLLRSNGELITNIAADDLNFDDNSGVCSKTIDLTGSLWSDLHEGLYKIKIKVVGRNDNRRHPRRYSAKHLHRSTLVSDVSEPFRITHPGIEFISPAAGDTYYLFHPINIIARVTGYASGPFHFRINSPRNTRGAFAGSYLEGVTCSQCPSVHPQQVSPEDGGGSSGYSYMAPEEHLPRSERYSRRDWIDGVDGWTATVFGHIQEEGDEERIIRAESGAFTVKMPDFRVTHPNSSSTWRNGQRRRIRWEIDKDPQSNSIGEQRMLDGSIKNNLPRLRIELYKDGQNRSEETRIIAEGVSTQGAVGYDTIRGDYRWHIGRQTRAGELDLPDDELHDLDPGIYRIEIYGEGRFGFFMAYSGWFTIE